MENRKKASDHYFQGKYSREEYFAVQKEFEKETADPEFLNGLEQQWDAIQDGPVQGFNKQTLWNRISTQLHFNLGGQIKTLTFLNVLQRVAAILFIPLAIGFLFYLYSNSTATTQEAWAEIVCPSGVRVNFQLPDGSTGVLNSESRLKYAVNFSTNRSLELEGQAYFDVVKDAEHPFQVKTSNLNVQVLGTSFSVYAFPGTSNEEIVLKTGKVKISAADEKPLALLSPDQKFVLDTDKRKYYTENVNATVLTSWIDGKLIFKNEPFVDVAERLARWYNVDIEIQDPGLKNYKYYGTFENESLDEAIRLLVLTAPIIRKEVKRKQQSDGTYSKRKIILATDERRINDF